MGVKGRKKDLARVLSRRCCLLPPFVKCLRITFLVFCLISLVTILTGLPVLLPGQRKMVEMQGFLSVSRFLASQTNAFFRRGNNMPSSAPAPKPMPPTPMPVITFDEKLIKSARIDPDEEHWKKLIDWLLTTAAAKNSVVVKSIPSPSTRFSREFPNRIRTPRFTPHVIKFGLMLEKWSAFRGIYDPHIMEALLEAVKTPVDEYFVRLNHLDVNVGRRYKTCAVVGNSGILLNQSYGGFIDSHEMVMRLNNARITQHARHVGAKTTFSFMNSHILYHCAGKVDCPCHPYGSHVPLVLYLCTPEHTLEVAACGSELHSPVLLTDARFDKLCARIAKWYSITNFVKLTKKDINTWILLHKYEFHYSSGLQAIMLSLGICDRVNIFGFGKSSILKHHFHSNQKNEHHSHDYEAEYLFYADLAQNRHSSIPFLRDAGIEFPPLQIYR